LPKQKKTDRACCTAKSCKQDSNDTDIQSIDGEVFMAEINDQEERHTNVKTKVSGKAVSHSPILLIFS
jgi:hypothetical protein